MKKTLQFQDASAGIFNSSVARMWQMFIFGIHWKYNGKMYYGELSAGSKEEAAEYFN